jgi:hypothetical protein
LNVLRDMSRQANDGDAVLLGDGAVADAARRFRGGTFRSSQA